MQSPKIILALLALTACAPPVPDSTAGVGFDNYSDYVRQREAGVTGAGASGPVGQPLGAVPSQPTFSTDAVGAAIDNAESGNVPPTGRVIGQTPYAATEASRPRGSAPIGIKEESGEMAGSTVISDEQDFKAVSDRETIDSDRARLEQNRSQYQEIAPTAVPTRTGSGGVNIVEFALTTTNNVGETLYRRFGILTEGMYNRACAKFAAPDLAQIAFLEKGGPQKDRIGVDPDGDGFACSWDPQPFRNARK